MPILQITFMKIKYKTMWVKCCFVTLQIYVKKEITQFTNKWKNKWIILLFIWLKTFHWQIGKTPVVWCIVTMYKDFKFFTCAAIYTSLNDSCCWYAWKKKWLHESLVQFNSVQFKWAVLAWLVLSSIDKALLIT